MKLEESRLKRKSQMYETTRDHGFGNNVYLYSMTGEFLGICLNDTNTIVAAICKNRDISKLKFMCKEYSAEKYHLLAARLPSQTQFYQMYKNNIWFVKKNFPELWVRENLRGKYNKYEVIKIYDRWNRLVIDNETHTFYQLHIIPKDFKLTLKRVPISEINKAAIYRKANCSFIEIDLTPYPMPKYICDSDARIDATGYMTFVYTNKHQFTFKITHVWKVIEKLEKIGFRFTKDALYKQCLKFKMM